MFVIMKRLPHTYLISQTFVQKDIVKTSSVRRDSVYIVECFNLPTIVCFCAKPLYFLVSPSPAVSPIPSILVSTPISLSLSLSHSHFLFPISRPPPPPTPQQRQQYQDMGWCRRPLQTGFVSTLPLSSLAGL